MPGQVSKVKAMLEFCESRGLGDKWVYAEHDVIYFPLENENDPETEILKTLGLHWDEENGAWATFV